MPFDGKPEQYTESQVKQDLRAALYSLGPNGEDWWVKDKKHGKHCALLALLEVTVRKGRVLDFNPAIDRLAGAMGVTGGNTSYEITRFNDTHTFAEVRAAFEKAILIS
jgi:hypothetical protein